MVDELTATVLGAAIAGVIGVLAVFTQQWLVGRQWLWDNVLGPELDFSKAFTDETGRQTYAVYPWRDLPWHARVKVQRNLRDLFSELDDALDVFWKADTAFNNYLSGERQTELFAIMKARLRSFTNPDGENIAWSRVGADGGGTYPLTGLFQGSLRPIIRHWTSADDAWREAETEVVKTWSYGDQVIRAIRREDSTALVEIHKQFVNHPAVPRARELLAESDRRRDEAQEQALIVRRLLSHKLPALRLALGWVAKTG